MSKKSKVFPNISLPVNRGDIYINDVLKISDPTERDKQIHEWCASVWDAFTNQHLTIIEITEYLIK